MDYDEAKAEVLRLHPAQIHAKRVAQLADREHAAAGFVIWDAHFPANSNWNEHKETFVDAIYTALAFCPTLFQHEWVVVGRAAAVMMRSVSKFKEAEGIACWPTRLIYIGQLGIITVYMDVDLPTHEFLAGVRDGKGNDYQLCSRGTIQNSPISFGGAEPWRALQEDALDDDGEEILPIDPATFLPRQRGY